MPFTVLQVLELVFQNNRAGAFGGEMNSSDPNLTTNRQGREQHPLHMHGGHFWLVGAGFGAWDASKVDTEYNLVNPPLRDTGTLYFADAGATPGWLAIRFVANNPGEDKFRCHD